MRSRGLLPVLLLSNLLTITVAQAESYVKNVIVAEEDNCPSGIKFGLLTTADGDPITIWRCVLPNKKFNLQQYVGQTIKVRFEYGPGVYKLKEIDPDAAVGSKKGGMSDILVDALDPNGTVAAVATSVADAEQQPQGSSRSAPAARPQLGDSGEVGTHPNGANQCISDFWDDSGGFAIYALRNTCDYAVNVRFVNRKGGGGSMDLAPGTSQQTGDTRDSMKKNGSYESYACPYHFIARDPNGNYFNRPISTYRCDAAGY